MVVETLVSVPRTVETYIRALYSIDVRDRLSRIDVPTVPLHRAGWALVPIELARSSPTISGAPSWSSCPAPMERSPEADDLTIETVRRFLAEIATLDQRQERTLAATDPPSHPACLALGG
jgi:hypothetical protein